MKSLGKILFAIVIISTITACEDHLPEKREIVPKPDFVEYEKSNPDKTLEKYIKTSFKEEGKIESEFGEVIEYYYDLPELLIKSETADWMNSDFADFKIVIKEDIEKIKNNEIPQLVNVKWDAYIKNNVLSVVVVMRDEYFRREYFVYNYDLEKDICVYNDDILKNMNLTSEEVIHKVRRNEMQQFDLAMQGIPTDKVYREMYYDREFIYRSHIISQINIDDIKLYQTEKDDRAVYYMSNPMVGRYCSEVVLNPEENNDIVKNEKLDFINATLKGNKAYISFEECEDAKYFLMDPKAEFFDIEFNKEYEISGMHHDYSDIFLGSIGSEFRPYLMLITKEQGLEIVDLYSGCFSKNWLAIPVSGSRYIKSVKSEDIEKYEEMSGEYYNISTIKATNDNGESYDMLDYIQDIKFAMPQELKNNGTIISDAIIHKLDSGGSYSSIYYFDFMNDGFFQFEDSNPDVGISLNYEGYYECAGMNEEGVLYNYILYNSDFQDTLYGTMLFVYEDDKVMIKCLSGDDLFDKDGEFIIFYKTGVFERES